jgi:Flp pilus assembly secretin CpaC
MAIPGPANVVNVVATLPDTVVIDARAYRVDRRLTAQLGSIALRRDGQPSSRAYYLAPLPNANDGSYVLRKVNLRERTTSEPFKVRNNPAQIGRTICVLWVGDMLAEVDRFVVEQKPA